MSFNYNIDIAARLVQSVVDNIRCLICGKSDGERVRYPCGDTVCRDCSDTSPSCMICLSAPDEATKPVLDEVLSGRVKHVGTLLTAFQDTFNIDVTRYRRISRQLKLEKELFPECIQVQQTYHNKRKSERFSKNKENRYSIIPGEKVEASDTQKMDNSKNNVLEWLDQHESEFFECKPRKPLSDICVNNIKVQRSPFKKQSNIISDKNNKTSKRSDLKSDVKYQSHFNSYISRKQSLDKEKDSPKNTKTIMTTNICEQKNRVIDESGISLDDSIVTIEDSQSQVIDKDRLAWLAVVEANKNDTIDMESAKSDDENYIQTSAIATENCTKTNMNLIVPVEFKVTDTNINEFKQKIPFYKKSKLLETCTTCIRHKKQTAEQTYQEKDIKISVETSTFVTNIKITKCKSEINNKLSKSIQTDKIPENKTDSLDNRESQDLFTGQHILLGLKKEDVSITNQNVVIDSSDSEMEQSSTFIVEADVHMTKSDNNPREILTEISANHKRLQRVLKRTHSFQSSNSSDKENRDPNSKRRMCHGKKEKIKKF